jgi:hypothetical protein
LWWPGGRKREKRHFIPANHRRKLAALADAPRRHSIIAPGRHTRAGKFDRVIGGADAAYRVMNGLTDRLGVGLRQSFRGVSCG